MSNEAHNMDIHVPDDVVVVVYSDVTPQYMNDAARQLRSITELPVICVNQSLIKGKVRVHRSKR